MNRRQFLRTGAAGGLLAACGPRGAAPVAGLAEPSGPEFSEPRYLDMADAALQAATEAGASYADIRFSWHRTQTVSTREARVTRVSDGGDEGFGVRVLVDGTWGFAAAPVATTDEVADPHKLGIRLRLNGETLQDSNTDQLVFGIPELIEDLSTWFTLEPGDVIATGTPPGVGFARKPPVYLKAGDVCEVEIDGLGVLRNPVAAFEG